LSDRKGREFLYFFGFVPSMNFNSSTFAVFMLVVGLLYVLTQLAFRPRWPQNLMLLLASYGFYAAWDKQFLFLILISTAGDYVCGLAMKHRTPTVRNSVILSLSLLFSGLVLCAPIDWSGLLATMLPASFWAGGWIEQPVYRGLIDPEGSWRNALGAMVATAALGIVLTIGYLIDQRHWRKYFIWVSMVSNLGLLAFFKYCDFFLEGLTTLLSGLGMGDHHWALGVIVPVGISFYTFQTMSYTLDIYRGEIEPTDNLLDFSLFVAFFPQLVAGPIERAAHLLPQFYSKRPFNWDQWRSGCYLIGWGLFKKIYIADNMIPLVNLAYGAEPGTTITGPMVWLSTLAFAVQIYCDFSAYSDIARGLSRLMGIELMVNFNLPYFATNPKDFWSRWHISLSTWLRDYLYIPLGGNRGGPGRTYFNLMTTMVLGGIWHGARANFVWWGIYQGAMLCIHRFFEPIMKPYAPKSAIGHRVLTFINWVIFMHFVGYGWLLFRASTNKQIGELTTALLTGWTTFGDHLAVLAKIVFYAWPLVIVQICQYRASNLLVVLTWPWYVRCALYLLLFYLTVIFGAFDVVEFIYFQF